MHNRVFSPICLSSVSQTAQLFHLLVALYQHLRPSPQQPWHGGGKYVMSRPCQAQGPKENLVPKRNCWVKHCMPSLGRIVLFSARQVRATRRVEFSKTSWSQDISTITSTGRTFMINVPTSAALLFNDELPHCNTSTTTRQQPKHWYHWFFLLVT
jgi:hypothetical protein